MAPQFCPECGTVVPVDDGFCHLGHPVPADAEPDEATAAGAGAPAHDEPTPWVATVEDDDLDPAAPAPEEAAVTDHTPPEPSEEDTSLEDLAAMAAASDDRGQDDETDLSRLQDDLSGDLGSDLGADVVRTGASPDADDLDATSADDGFDLSALEEAVADLEGDAPEPPPGGPQAPGPHDAPSSEPSVTPLPGTPESGDGTADEAAAAAAGASEPHAEARSTHPDRDDSPPADAPRLDPTNFTASGRKVSSPSGGSSSGGLLDKLKGLFGR